MQKRSLFITVLMVLTLLLAACSSSGSQNNQPAGTALPTGTGAVPNTGQTPATTGQAVGTAAATPMGSVTPGGVGTNAAPTAASTTAATSAATTVATTVGTTPAVTGTPNASGQGVGTSIVGIPQTGQGLAGLAAMFDFQVVDSSGNNIGTVQDYVINTCEANLLYIVVNPASGVVSNANGQQVLIPYQATLATPNSGKVDASKHQFVINASASDLANVPTVDINNLNLQTPDWEANQMTFWKSHNMRLALTSGCSVPVHNNSSSTGGASQQAGTVTPGAGNAQGTPSAQAGSTAQPAVTARPTRSSNRQEISRIALASKILSTPLQDGNGVQLGTVRDAAIVPETGHLQYLIVQASTSGQSSSRLVALPLASVTIKYADNSNQPVFVLLVSTQIYQNAPEYNVGSPNETNWFNYWQKYVPMTMNQLP